MFFLVMPANGNRMLESLQRLIKRRFVEVPLRLWQECFCV